MAENLVRVKLGHGSSFLFTVAKGAEGARTLARVLLVDDNQSDIAEPV